MPSNANNCVQRQDRLQSTIIDTPHGMWTRHGGSSTAAFSTLNLSFHVGDDPDHVAANRRQIKKTLGVERLVSSKQIHSNQIYHVEEVTEDIELDGYDALMTQQPGVALLVQQADCQAVLLHDPE